MQTTDHHTVLLEYDRRFEIYREKFIFYDYNDPLNLPEGLQEGSFDLVVVDPPFLSKECLSKVAQTVKFLTKEKVILCTGTWRNADRPMNVWIVNLPKKVFKWVERESVLASTFWWVECRFPL